MRNRVPVAASQRAPIPDFTPVPRKYRHDGWTPERQKAFIEALADCGSVTRAAGMVNMAQANCYTLRRAPGAEAFRAAWDAALDFGVKRLKDIAFERAVEGELVPVFVGGKLMGFRRKHNDALLMFCLRHYGEDAQGKRTTINYFSTRASSGASTSSARAGPVLDPASGSANFNLDPDPDPHPHSNPNPAHPELVEGSHAEASTTTVRTVINAPGAAVDLGAAAGVLNGFDGVVLDAEAQAAIAAALAACAARARESEAGPALAAAEDDPEVPFVRVADGDAAYAGALVPGLELEAPPPFSASEADWRQAGAEVDEYWVETAEKLGMLAPVDPVRLPAGGGRRRRKAR